MNNDTILNYYYFYFQMTKHDVTSRLPASQTRKNITRGKSCWNMEGKSCEKFCVCFFLFGPKLRFCFLHPFNLNLNSFAVTQKSIKHFKNFFMQIWALKLDDSIFFINWSAFNVFIVRNCAVAIVLSVKNMFYGSSS